MRERLGAAERVGCASRRRSCRVSDRLRSRRRTAGARIGAGIGAGIAPHEAPVMLLGCRLRRSEVAALTMGHVQQRDGRWGIVERGRPPGAGGVSRAAYGSHTSMKIVRLHLLPNLYRTQTTATAQGHACLIVDPNRDGTAISEVGRCYDGRHAMRGLPTDGEGLANLRATPRMRPELAVPAARPRSLTRAAVR